MHIDGSRFWPYLIALAVVMIVYRRLRRNFGRQPLRPAVLWVRMALFGLIGCSMLPLAMRGGEFAFADAAGLAAGVALGVYGARRTRYQNYGGRLHYIPHTYTGLAVSLIFLSRLVYRFVQMSSGGDPYAFPNGGTGTAVFGPGMLVRSPATVALLYVVIGYYVSFYGLVLRKSRHIAPEDLEADSAPTAAPL